MNTLLVAGNDFFTKLAIKPTPSIDKEQKTVDLLEMTDTSIKVKGRHDACIVPKAVPVVESAVALVLIDQMLRAGLIPKVLGVEAVGEYDDTTEED